MHAKCHKAESVATKRPLGKADAAEVDDLSQGDTLAQEIAENQKKFIHSKV